MSSEYVKVPREALNWLFGEGPDAEGHWFGDGDDAAKAVGRYWWRTKFRAMLASAPPAPVSGREELIKVLTDRFLLWPLPKSVRSDLCATQDYPYPRSGTNLLTADEAGQMVEYLLEAIPAASAEAASEGELLVLEMISTGDYPAHVRSAVRNAASLITSQAAEKDETARDHAMQLQILMQERDEARSQLAEAHPGMRELTKADVLAAVNKAIAPYSAYICAQLRCSQVIHPPRASLVLARLKALAVDGLLERSNHPAGYYGYRWTITPAGRQALGERDE